jgi:hydroxyacylglutathione hydrolase
MRKPDLRHLIVHSSLALLMSVALSFAIDNGDSLRIHPIPAGMGIAFAVESPGGLFLVDAGSPGHGKSILKHLQKFSGKPLRLIIITHGHFDHYGSAGELKGLTGAPIAIHGADAKDMEEGRTSLPLVHGLGRIGKFLLPLAEFVTSPKPTHADILLHDGDSLTKYGLPAIVVATPGHTPGSISILLDNGTAFTGDLVVTSPRLDCQCFFASSWRDLDTSLIRMQKLRPKQVFSGHSVHAISGDKFQEIKPVRDWAEKSKR